MAINRKTNEKISSTVRNWYEFSRDLIPAIGTHSFISFVAGTSSLGAQVTSKVANYRFIIDPESESAYIDSENKRIALPTWYLDEKVLGEMFGEDSDLEAISLSLCNGSHIHESLHARYTQPTKITDFFSTLSPAEAKFMRDNENVAAAITNFVEDMYIETLGRHNINDFLNDMVANKNALLFTDEDVKKMLNDLSEETDKAKVASLLINVFGSMKNVAVRPMIERNSTVFTKFSRLPLPSNFFSHLTSEWATVNRATYAYQVTKAILEGLDEKERKEVGDKTGNESKGKGESGKGSKMGSPEKTPSSMKIEGSMTEGEESEVKAEFEATAKMMMVAASMKKSEEQSKDKTSYVGLPSVEYYDDIFAFASRPTHFSLRQSTNNFGFVNTLRQLRTKNHTNGVVRTSGSHLINQRLYRIGTDGKMFSNLEHEKESANKLAVVILIDASGSMHHMFESVVAEALAMYKALRECNIPTAVYAHTSADDDKDAPGLYRIIDSGINRNETQANERFTAALKINLVENYDGAIIESLVKRAFGNVPANTKKLLFVLSDGAPMGSRYVGRTANDHTKNAIAAARKQDIFVASISLVDSVVWANDNIYGKEYNVNASANLRKSFENLVIKMQEEGRL